jgi:anti-sigma-K factor RskA
MYASGLTTNAETLQVQAWLLQYPALAEELKSIEQGLESFALANAVEPGADVKTKLFAQINATATAVVTEPAKVISIKKNYWKLAAAATAALLIGSTALTFNYYNKYSVAQTKLKETTEQLAAASQQVKDLNDDLEPVRNKYSKAVSLNGMPQMPDASAKIFWLTNNGDVMIDASNLPDAPAGKQYQFWAIVDGKPVDGGLIVTKDKGKKLRMQKMKTFGRAEAFAISLEKEGGNPTPTVVVSMGKI